MLFTELREVKKRTNLLRLYSFTVDKLGCACLPKWKKLKKNEWDVQPGTQERYRNSM